MPKGFFVVDLAPGHISGPFYRYAEEGAEKPFQEGAAEQTGIGQEVNDHRHSDSSVQRVQQGIRMVGDQNSGPPEPEILPVDHRCPRIVNPERDPGDEFLMNFTLIKKMASAWKLRLGCAFAQKGPDLFSGQSFQKSQYSMLGFGSATKSVLGQMGLSYSPELLNRWFNRGFHLLGVNLDLHAPLWGMNISANPIFELGLSFAY